MKRIALLLLLIIGIALAGPDVSVSGLFKDRAVLVIDGKTQMLKVGQVSPEGVKLLSSTSKEAVVEIDGHRYTMVLSRHIATEYTRPAQKEVRIPIGASGHYFTSGLINGRNVVFMVDTGASTIAMSLKDADLLGVNYRLGSKERVNTAGGVVNSYRIKLDKVTVGSITLRSIEAVVIIGDYPTTILLGNSFLKLVGMTKERGVMVLRAKY